MDADRLFYVMIVVIALIGVGLFAIPVGARDHPSRESRDSAGALDAATYFLESWRDSVGAGGPPRLLRSR